MSSNIAIISATVAVITLVLAIFGASWLNQRNIEKPLEQLENRFDARFETVLTEIRRLDQRIDSVEHRLDRIERQLEAVFKSVPPGRT
jgi:septation ring formation regulator EzrA